MLAIKSIFYLSRFAIAIVAVLVIFMLSHIPQEHQPYVLTILGVDKILHIIAYALITGLTLRAVKLPLRWKFYLGLLISVAVFGWFDEYTQQFVGRSCSIYDWAADMIGIMVATAFYKIYASKSDISTDPNLR